MNIFEKQNVENATISLVKENQALKTENEALRFALGNIVWKVNRKEQTIGNIFDWAKINIHDAVIQEAIELLNTPGKEKA